MTPDTIITAELLAGLKDCPFCGSRRTKEHPINGAEFSCDSSYYVGHKASLDRSWCCEAKEATRKNTTLRARVKELEDALGSIREYWNRDNNENAMQDACWHAVNTAAEALEKGTK